MVKSVSRGEHQGRTDLGFWTGPPGLEMQGDSPRRTWTRKLSVPLPCGSWLGWGWWDCGPEHTVGTVGTVGSLFHPCCSFETDTFLQSIYPAVTLLWWKEHRCRWSADLDLSFVFLLVYLGDPDQVTSPFKTPISSFDSGDIDTISADIRNEKSASQFLELGNCFFQHL